MTHEVYTDIWDAFGKGKKVLVSLHLGPDGDSLGSCLALKYVLENYCGSEVTVISKDNLDAGLMETDFVEGIEFGNGIEDVNLEEYDLVVLPDSGSLKQFVAGDFKLPESVQTINIDHHATNERFCQINYVDTSKISCCSVLLEFFQMIGLKFDSELSTYLLLGIFTDSGFFAHNQDCLIEAGFLVEHGAQYKERISDPIRFNVPLRIKKYDSLMVQKFKIVEVKGLKVGHSVISAEEIKSLGLSLSDARGAVNYLQEIGGIDLLFTITEVNGLLKGSFRSRKGIDISTYAQALGGGGHKLAAAFKLPIGNLDEAVKKVLDIIEKMPIVKV